MQIANRVQQVEKSETLRVKEKALELRRQGVDVIDLTAGEPDFPTPSHICAAGEAAIRDGFTKYTASAGIPELRQAIVDKLSRENQLQYQPEQIIVTVGAKPAIITALWAILNPGDEVIIPAPYWVSYPQQVRMADGVPVIVDTRDSGFKITPQALENHITPRTRAFLFNSPCNPTGVVYTPDELQALADVLKGRNIWILSDEIYEKIIFDDQVHRSIAGYDGLYHQTIVINGVSKAYAMTGWRIGYAAGPTEIIQAMNRLQSHFTTPPSISQKAALVALTGDQSPVEEMRRRFQKRRDILVDGLKQIPGLSFVYPEGAFYLFVNVSGLFGRKWNRGVLKTSLDVCDYLIETQHLVAVPGKGFGAPDYIRLSFATSEAVLEKAIVALKQAVQALNQ
ncbi:MAG: pyridoxal phosphate-dependent aminotransferase [Calditrichaeota bacterium]|nr:pyridoxal phosphate-dependent aminotransferase [Calditrichota bacterium]